MPVNLDPSLRYRCLLSLIVLIANTAAPLYSRNGRALLATGGHPVATQSVARVRVVSHVSTIQGFRAPVHLPPQFQGKHGRPDLDLESYFLSSA